MVHYVVINAQVPDDVKLLFLVDQFSYAIENIVDLQLHPLLEIVIGKFGEVGDKILATLDADYR